jgi:hypothetical protein
MAVICGELEDNMRARDERVDVKLYDTGYRMLPPEWMDSYHTWRSLAMYYEVNADGPQVTYKQQNIGVSKR